MAVKDNLRSFFTDANELDQCQYKDDESDSEVASDFRGRKHVEKFENTDGMYWLLDNTRSSCVVFPVPGKTSADALREFLEGRLPHNLITDEYGCSKILAEISDDHLPTLQAQLWLNNSYGSVKTTSQLASLDNRVQACSSFAKHCSNTTSPSAASILMAQEALLVASHVTFVAELLQSNHIFALPEKPRGTCEFPACRTRSDDQPLASTTLTIEPLVHWGTVTPITDTPLCHSRILVFRRGGEKCGDPLWTQALKRFTPQHPTSYCSQCLEMLMDNRTEACVTVEQKKPLSFTAFNQPDPALHTKGSKIDYTLRGNDRERFTIQRRTRFPKAVIREDGHSTSCESSVNQAMAASLSHDGACDAPPDSPFHSSDLVRQNNGENSDSSLDKTRSPATEDSPPRRIPFTPASTMPFEGATSHSHSVTSAWTTANQTPFLPPTLAHHFRPYSDPQPTSMPEHKSSGSNGAEILRNHKTFIQAGVDSKSCTPIQSIKRKFGREIDTNAVLNAPKKPTRVASEMKMLNKDTKQGADIRNFLVTALNPIPRPIKSALRGAKALSRIPFTRDESTEAKSETSWETATTADSQVPNEHVLLLPTSKVCPPRKIKPLPKKKAPAQPKADKPASSKAGTHAPFEPFFAKRTPITAPDTINEHIYQEHQTRRPSAKEIICSCRKPARTPDVMIAQCSNIDCVIGWYHYDCLDKSSKISCRHGKLICQHCKNEMYFKDMEKQNGWSIEKMVESESKMLFTGQEMLAAMPGLGGGMGVVNPYGFGVTQEQDATLFTPTPGALGSLAFLGYVESSPLAAKDAYITAQTYANHQEYDEAEEDYYEYDEYEYEYEEEEYGEEFDEGKEDVQAMDVD